MRKLLIAALLATLSVATARGQVSGAGQLSCSGATITGTAATSGTANNTVLASLASSPAYGVLVQLDQTSTVTGGVITFQLSYDGGTNYISVPVAQVLNPSTGAQLTNPYTLVASTNQSFLVVLAGASNFQVKLTTAITGSATVTPYLTSICTAPAVGPLTLDANGNLLINIKAQSLGKVLVTPDSVALPLHQSTNVDQWNGITADTNSGNKSAGTLRVILATDQPSLTNSQPSNLAQVNGVAVATDNGNGRQMVGTYPDTVTTSYHTSKKFALSSTTDIAVFPGNATNTVLVTRVILSCTQTTAGIVNVELLKRSTADTAGTSAAMTAVPDDSNYAAAVSAPLSYTGTGPTVGTAVGDLDNYQVGCNAAATVGPNDIYIFKPTKPILLRGTAQQVAINLGGAVTGGTGTVTFEWIETTTP